MLLIEWAFSPRVLQIHYYFYRKCRIYLKLYCKNEIESCQILEKCMTNCINFVQMSKSIQSHFFQESYEIQALDLLQAFHYKLQKAAQ